MLVPHILSCKRPPHETRLNLALYEQEVSTLEKHLELEIQEFMEKVLYRNVPATLFHYTDSHGALGILNNNEFWLSHALYSNDKSELSYAIQTVSAIATEFLTGKDYPVGYKEDSLKQYYVRVFLEKTRSFLENKMIKTDVYVGCFCQNPDLLSQWRAYANNTGFCIGFEAKKLLNNTRDNYTDYEVFFAKVSYDQSLWAEWAKRLLKLVCADILKKGSNIQTELEMLSSAYANFVTDQILITAPFLKHPGFQEEQEWRLAIITEPKKMKPEFRVGRVGLMPYLSSATDGTVSNVVIGPSANHSLSNHVLQLIRGNSEIEISSSGVPLR